MSMDLPAEHHACALKLLRPELSSLDNRLYVHIVPESEQMLLTNPNGERL